MSKANKIMTYFINLCFFLYFVILITERSMSVILSFTKGINIFSDAFHGFTYMLVFLSIGAFLIYLIIKCRDAMKALFVEGVEINFMHLCIASGILLLSGMVHTEYTTPVIQFVSYGILIVGILLKVILSHKESKNKPVLWLSFVYLVCFSMAIPVMYQSMIELHTLFHIIEGVAVFALVGAFTYLFILIFKGENNLFKLWPIIVAVALDAALIILRWNEEINWFVLIFIFLSLVMFIVGFIVSKIKKQD